VWRKTDDRRDLDVPWIEINHFSTQHDKAEMSNNEEVQLCSHNYVKYRTRVNLQILALPFILN